MMKLRLSNQIDWAHEFTAQSAQQLKLECKAAWLIHASKFGISPARLYLQVNVTGTKEWSTSGQYTLDGKHNLPPVDHEVKRTGSDFYGLFSAALLSAEHASKMEGLISWSTTLSKEEIEINRSNIKLLK
jgi:hypothetical protein